MQDANRLRGLILAGLSALFFGSSIVVNKVGLQSGLAAFDYTLLLNFTMGLLSLAFVVRDRRKIARAPRRILAGVLFLALAASVVASSLLLWGQSLTSAINAAFLVTLSAFFTVFFATVLFGESIDRRRYPYILLLLAGVYLLVVGIRGLQFNQGDLILILSSLIWGFTSAYARRLMGELAGDQIAYLRLVLGGILFIFLIPIVSPAWLHGFGGMEPWFLLSGLLTWGFLSVYYKAIEILGATPATLIYVFYPIVSTVLSVAFLGETLRTAQAAGGLLILGSVYQLLRPAREA